MDCASPTHRSKLKLTISHDNTERRKTVTLDQLCLNRIKGWNVSVCLYVVVRYKTIQYVGCSTRDFFKRFTHGIRQAHTVGYRWPTSDGHYQLFIWKIDGGRDVVESVEAEVAFLQRAVLGDWPIELNQLSPKRHLVQPQASAFGKSLAFEIYSWLMLKQHIAHTPGDIDFLKQLRARSIIC